MKTKQLKIEKSVPNLWSNKWVVLVRPTGLFERTIVHDLGFSEYPFSFTDVMEPFVEVVFVIADNQDDARRKAVKALKEKGFPEYSYGDTWFKDFIMKSFKAPEEYALMFFEPVKVLNHNSTVFRNQLLRMW